MKKLLRFLCKPLSLLNRMIPKDPKLVLFYSNLGFRDNVRALYDECVRRELGKEVRMVCSLNDYQKYTPPEGQNVRFVGNWRGVLTFFRAGAMFYSFGKYPITPSPAQKVINVWHGMPLKAVGRMVPGCEKIRYNYFTYIIATAPFFSGILQKSFGCGSRQILYCGQPRCDRLFHKDIPPQKLILWLPTYRASDTLAGADSDAYTPFGVPLLKTHEDCERINDCLVQNGYVMLVKPHPLQNKASSLEGLSHIRLVNEKMLAEKNTDIYTLFRQSRALLTDYSSVLFDYLLLGKPLGFVLPDYESYRDTRGFAVEDPSSLMPGPRITSIDELLRFIEDVAAERDSYEEERRRVNELCNTYQTGDSTGVLLQAAGLPVRVDPLGYDP